jgi:glycosyltransferase involved in cell wall biosynthesis
MKIASLCVLSYKRPERLRACIDSLIQNTSYPYELIVNADGNDDQANIEYLLSLYRSKRISKLILNSGENRGVGKSFANCIGVADGDYIVKIDTDLTFQPHWLEKGVEILDEGLINAVSFFNYRHYDPNDVRFNIISATDKYCIVDDFVSSIYMFKREHLKLGGFNADDGFHSKLRPLAITPEDYVSNHGFGVTKSVYVSGTEDHPFKTKTFDKPLIFNDIQQ